MHEHMHMPCCFPSTIMVFSLSRFSVFRSFFFLQFQFAWFVIYVGFLGICGITSLNCVFIDVLPGNHNKNGGKLKRAKLGESETGWQVV